MQNQIIAASEEKPDSGLDSGLAGDVQTQAKMNTETLTFDLNKFSVSKFDSLLSRGLCEGVGQREGQMCIEAAICTVLDLPHGDDPGCVSPAVRSFKISLNDSGWSSPEARAKGLRDLGLAQLGSKGVVNDVEFSSRLAIKVTQKLVPKLFREIFKDKPELLAHADKCEGVETLRI
jgi:hypothetical protein